MPDPALVGLIAIIALALAFDFINGFHDTANAIATSVATRVLSPGQAVLMAGVLNVVGALTGTAVAKTVGKDIVAPEFATLTLVAAALLSAITWNLLTWWRGLPSSSSHALVFSIVGAGVAEGGWRIIEFKGLQKTFAGLFASPPLGFLVPIVLMLILILLVRRWKPRTVTRVFGRLQILSAAYMAFSHGGNDAQKTMGVITMALAAYLGWQGNEWSVPLWVVLSAAVAMGLGTATGGWRIIKTMGHNLVALRPIDGFVAEVSAATIIETATRLGIPVSTTHVISTSIMGVGTAKGARNVQWGVAGRIVTAWVLTIPSCVALGYLWFKLVHLIAG
ncbi:inorganic phosphate transporter [Deinococcus yavapaiensis]|uniref:PiT family inorganic phosphate transporter n=1 Tax=Deinococcus yavapaiensis KR-236 TaxID=694435 RepID=A0A318SJH8_9DEIO|nr:inorganic phosphate transporter [Deinococcus yavapaiensis]PYE52718.1 PiT family inorganic phosphate transporter [Deinococcus yavapaiensis KR-236]